MPHLDSLSLLGASVEDVLTSLVATHEGDGAHAGRIAQEVHRVHATVHHLHDTVGDTRLLGELHEDHRGSGVLLRGLQDHGVATRRGGGEHPQGNHGGEVEGADTGGDTEGLAVSVGVQALGQVAEGLTHQVLADVAGCLHDLQATEHITSGIGKSLALRSVIRIAENEVVRIDDKTVGYDG